MSESLARQIFARTAAEGMCTYIYSMREILDDSGEDAERQLETIRRLLAKAKTHADNYAKARGIDYAKI